MKLYQSLILGNVDITTYTLAKAMYQFLILGNVAILNSRGKPTNSELYQSLILGNVGISEY